MDATTEETNRKRRVGHHLFHASEGLDDVRGEMVRALSLESDKARAELLLKASQYLQMAADIVEAL